MPALVQSILHADSISIDSIFPSVIVDANGCDVFKRRMSVGTLDEINTIVGFSKIYNAKSHKNDYKIQIK